MSRRERGVGSSRDPGNQRTPGRSAYPDFLCYYFRGAPSFASILDMDMAQARSFLAAHDRDWRARPDYLDYRIEVEDWIRRTFVRKGGLPTRRHPIYLSLGIERVLEEDRDYTGKLLLPLHLFNRQQISFTYLDSMHTKEGKTPYVFMIDEIRTMIDQHGTGYTEAQVWDGAPLEPIQEEYRSTGKLTYL